MFRRLDSALPKDPMYPATLEDLGYFINDKDEIRSINDPKAYFKFFLTKNDRYNCIQRESMNEAIRMIVSERLISLGLKKIRLPLNAGETEPHLPIFVSANIKTKKRVIVLFYEHNQDVGIFAHRIVGGKGGINEGSAVNLVKYIQSLPSSSSDSESPGIILANMGQLRWWRRGKKALTQTSWFALAQKSAVELPIRFDFEKNTVPGNRTTSEHVNYIFNTVVVQILDPEARLDVVGVSEGALKVAEFLENEGNWKKWGKRVDAFAAVATYYHANDIKNKSFAHWLQERGRAYAISNEPCGTFLAGPEGRKSIEAYGCPVFSLGKPYYSETMLPTGYKTVIDWFQEVASDADYANPVFLRYDAGGDSEDDEEQSGARVIERELKDIK